MPCCPSPHPLPPFSQSPSLCSPHYELTRPFLALVARHSFINKPHHYIMSNKRKWKVYTTDELRDRFQTKPGALPVGQGGLMTDDQKIPAPNLKRRNSAPPGMIHFPPGTFSASNSSQAPHSYLFFTFSICITILFFVFIVFIIYYIT